MHDGCIESSCPAFAIAFRFRGYENVPRNDASIGIAQPAMGTVPVAKASNADGSSVA